MGQAWGNGHVCCLGRTCSVMLAQITQGKKFRLGSEQVGIKKKKTPSPLDGIKLHEELFRKFFYGAAPV